MNWWEKGFMWNCGRGQIVLQKFVGKRIYVELWEMTNSTSEICGKKDLCGTVGDDK
jgi:hypothetical protein